MGEVELNARRLNSTRSGRLLTVGATGFALAVAVLMALAPASAGAVAHPSVVLKAPYKGTLASASIFTDLGGCAALKVVPAKWAATTGMLTSSVSASSHTCPKSIGTIGANSYADGGPGIGVAIPFKVGTNGNHSIGSSFTITLASSSAFAAPFCKLAVNYAPAHYQYSYGYCEAGTYISFSINAQLVDLNNATYSAYNSSYGDTYNDSYTENYSYCYNYSAPACYNNNGTHGYAGAYAYNAPGFSPFAMSGSTTFTMWTNGSMMVKTHHYAVTFSLYLSCDSFAEKYNVIGAWTGSSACSINMGTLGNGAKLNSVTIV